MANFNLGPGDNTFNAPTGEVTVNAEGGQDRLVVDYSGLSGPLVSWYDGWFHISDEAFNQIDYVNFEAYTITGGSESDLILGDIYNASLAVSDSLAGGAGNDTIQTGIGNDVIDGGNGLADRWVTDYSSLGIDIYVQLKSGGTVYTVAATGAQVKNVEALEISTGVGADSIDTSAVVGNDVIHSGGGDDTVTSGLGHDTVRMYAGTDTLVVNYATRSQNITYANPSGWVTYQDGVDPSASITYYEPEVENLWLTGGTGDDVLRGRDSYDGADKLTGNDGNDTLYGFGGVDTINGGTGTDTWVVVYDEVNANVEINISTAAGVTNTGASVSNVEQLSVDTYLGDDVIVARAGVFSDRIYTNQGDDTITTGRGTDTVEAGAGNDTLIVNWTAVTTNITHEDNQSSWDVYSSGSGDSVTHYNVDRFNVTGGSGNDYLSGYGGDDTLSGGNGDDVLNSRVGLANINGGAGTDYWQADVSAMASAVLFDALASQSSAQATGAGHSIRNIEGISLATGAGNDNLGTQGFATDDVAYTYGGNDTIALGRGADTVEAGAGADTLVIDWSAVTTDITHEDDRSSWDTYNSGSGDRVQHYNVDSVNVTGGSGNDYLSGYENRDTLVGGSGNDTLNSRAGTASIDGGEGTDLWRADVSAILTGLVVSAAGSQTTAQGTAAGHSISNIEGFAELHTGNGNDNISSAGYTGNDYLSTNGGNDTVNLGTGFDTVNGGDGNDTLVFDFRNATTAVSRSHDGWDTYRDAANTESVRYYSFETFNLAGGSGGDTLYGGDYHDTLTGNAGNDLLTGYGGKDSVAGGDGNDRWVGNYSGATAALSFTLNASGSGQVKANGVVSPTLSTSVSGIENITLNTGASNDTVITTGMRGNHVINSGGGDDTVKVGGGAHNINGEGETAAGDTLVVNFASSTTSVRHVYDAGWYKFFDTGGYNSARHVNFEQFEITGGSGADRLWAFGRDDKLSGGAGDDVLRGEGGNDILTGGTGNDLFVYVNGYGNGADTITDASVGDTIRVHGRDFGGGSVTVGDGTTVLANQVQLQAGTGQATLHIGLDGTAGADLSITLLGTFGATDFVLGGKDISVVGGSTTPGGPGDDVLVGTSGNDSLDGSDGNDSLDGRGGDDILDGGIGLDTLFGGTGADALTGGAGADRFVFTSTLQSSPGMPYHDTITDFVRGTDRIDLSGIDANPVLAGNQAFTWTASGFTGRAGQLYYDVADELVRADVNGDGITDLEILMSNGLGAMASTDFVL